ncbi:hypothetical protein [Ferrimonas sp. YFM]|uniref:hypothetical protein n=1 Tax=Ferrimonas sp. YFM TaxID=3028878 RepID=UPI0025731D42|nr:hypothetical protein [Ferrimonas sp. YFM]BDY04321.1 hypothetical protein F0521_13620 [Ferrimonas sp. YFM]
MKPWLGWLAFWALLPIGSVMADTQWHWQLSHGQGQSSHSVLFPDYRSADRQDALIGLSHQQGNWRTSASATWERDESGSTGQLWLQELVWQAPLADSDLELTLGKARIDWGVGYGYRPLDLFRGYRRHPLGVQVEEGVGVAALSHFTLDGEWTLIATDASWSSAPETAMSQASEQQGLGLRHYRMLMGHEWQLLGYYDDVRRGLIGASYVWVPTDALEIHGSALYQARFPGYQLTGQPQAPVALTSQHDAVQALLGLTWSHVSGHQLILEYWFDGRAWSQSQWQSALHRADAAKEVPSVQRTYAAGFANGNLTQHSLMLHWRLSAESLELRLDLLMDPQSQGVIATPRLNWSFEQHSLNLELAMRTLLGSADSPYRNLPDKRMIFVNLTGRF